MTKPTPCICGRRIAYRLRTKSGDFRVSRKYRVRHRCPHGEWCVRGGRGGENHNEPFCANCRIEFAKRRAVAAEPLPWQVCETCGGTIIDVEGMVPCSCKLPPDCPKIKPAADQARAAIAKATGGDHA